MQKDTPVFSMNAMHQPAGYTLRILQAIRIHQMMKAGYGKDKLDDPGHQSLPDHVLMNMAARCGVSARWLAQAGLSCRSRAEFDLSW